VSKPNSLHVEPSGILEIAARRGQLAVLSALLEAKIGIAFPEPCRASSSSTGTALWIGPERALLLADAPTVAAVCEAVTPARAALVDQTGGYVIWRLTGSDARNVLSRICRIDLHDSVFGSNHVARTVMAQSPTILHQVDDSPSFRLIVPNTLARSFGENIEHAAKASGIDLHRKSEPAS
jgi:heterotetrameric sarcosine oxidase gamma subunit